MPRLRLTRGGSAPTVERENAVGATTRTVGGMSRPRYPFRKLRGSVTVWTVAGSSTPKWHLIRDCEALTRTSDDRVYRRSWANLDTLLEQGYGRPCRKCALASFVITLCTRNDEHTVPFTVAPQPSPYRFDSNPYLSEYRRTTDSGAERIRKLAKRLNWAVSETSIGPVAVGKASETATSFLRENLRTARITADEHANPETVEMYWILAADTPPEAGGDLTERELWATAHALAT